MPRTKTNPAGEGGFGRFPATSVVLLRLATYTRLVRRSYELRFCWMLAVVLCLAASARATSQKHDAFTADDPVFVLPLDSQYASAQPHVTLSYAGAANVPVMGWEVSVFVDAKHCKLYCKFHHKASADPLLETELP